MIAMLVLVLLVLTIAGYVAGTLTVSTETPVSQWDGGVAYWAQRARYFETGPNAGWERRGPGNLPGLPGLSSHWVGIPLDVVADGTLIRACALLHDVSECCNEENCSWMCGHASERLNHPATFVECEWITVEENRRRLGVAF